MGGAGDIARIERGIEKSCEQGGEDGSGGPSWSHLGIKSAPAKRQSQKNAALGECFLSKVESEGMSAGRGWKF